MEARWKQFMECPFGKRVNRSGPQVQESPEEAARDGVLDSENSACGAA
jgi:hypothetical protein